mmetsp:Transcript_53604/g.149112  ORF Transcript_53604/g.149112 Transcript_53604/m.149112 type:complete len:312 (+) Transcript_53604:270-1205(+)
MNRCWPCGVVCFEREGLIGHVMRDYAPLVLPQRLQHIGASVIHFDDAVAGAETWRQWQHAPISSRDVASAALPRSSRRRRAEELRYCRRGPATAASPPLYFDRTTSCVAAAPSLVFRKVLMETQGPGRRQEHRQRRREFLGIGDSCLVAGWSRETQQRRLSTWAAVDPQRRELRQYVVEANGLPIGLRRQGEALLLSSGRNCELHLEVGAGRGSGRSPSGKATGMEWRRRSPAERVRVERLEALAWGRAIAERSYHLRRRADASNSGECGVRQVGASRKRGAGRRVCIIRHLSDEMGGLAPHEKLAGVAMA